MEKILNKKELWSRSYVYGTVICTPHSREGSLLQASKTPHGVEGRDTCNREDDQKKGPQILVNLVWLVLGPPNHHVAFQ